MKFSKKDVKLYYDGNQEELGKIVLAVCVALLSFIMVLYDKLLLRDGFVFALFCAICVFSAGTIVLSVVEDAFLIEQQGRLLESKRKDDRDCRISKIWKVWARRVYFVKLSCFVLTFAAIVAILISNVRLSMGERESRDCVMAGIKVSVKGGRASPESGKVRRGERMKSGYHLPPGDK